MHNKLPAKNTGESLGIFALRSTGALFIAGVAVFGARMIQKFTHSAQPDQDYRNADAWRYLPEDGSEPTGSGPKYDGSHL